VRLPFRFSRSLVLCALKARLPIKAALFVIVGILFLMLAAYASMRLPHAVVFGQLKNSENPHLKVSATKINRMTEFLSSGIKDNQSTWNDADVAFALTAALIKSARSQEKQEEALDLYQEATIWARIAAVTRPSWGSAWAYFALLKALLGEIDSEMESALVSGLKLSPNETDVQLLSFQAFMRAAPRLSLETRILIWPEITRVINGPRKAELHRWVTSTPLSSYAYTLYDVMVNDRADGP
jgi:hypothetical protein